MRRVRARILEEHRETIAVVIDAGKTVADAVEWPVADADTIRRPFERLVHECELAGPLLGLLDTGVTALGAELQGDPVPAPPYLVVTSRGPVCRGTLADGRRLVVELAVFAVETRPRRYRFRNPSVEECLRVQCR